ncbi:biotin-dependent carboxyltransferase family protein [Echinicola sediminis]
MKHSETYLEVIKASFYSNIQDKGRFGFGHWGIPTAGAMDQHSLDLANHLLRNQPEDACLEMTLIGGEYLFHGNSEIVLCGAKASITLNEIQVSMNEVLSVRSGDRLKIGPIQKGCRMYLGIKGGFQVKKVLSSRSFYKGITDEDQLNTGDQLPFISQTDQMHKTYAKVAWDESLIESGTLEVYAGPESEQLSEDTFLSLFEKEFRLSAQMNRMGIQLEETIENQLEEILTSPVYPGTVQLTPGGKLLILMRDAQVTGGYPRVLQLSQEAMNLIAQKKQGDKIRFKLISN